MIMLSFLSIFSIISLAATGTVAAGVDLKFLQEITPQIIQLAFDEQFDNAVNGNLKERQIMSELCARMSPPLTDLPALRHHAFLPPSAQTLRNSPLARVVERVTAELAARSSGGGITTIEDIQNIARQIDVNGTKLSENCPRNFQQPHRNCSDDDGDNNVRSIDGRCNNQQHPMWGAAGTAFARLLPANYEDGVSVPRATSKVSAAAAALPLARHVSTCMSPMFIKSHRTITIAFTFFGQLIDHDLGLAPMARIDDPNDLTKKIPPRCCNVVPECKHAECFELTLPDNDERYAPANRKCMEFVRTVPALRESCRLGYREQVNEPTHWLDASFNYASTEERARVVRAFVDGLLAVSTSPVAVENNMELGPARADDFECVSPSPDKHCFFAGDPRINENSILTALHQIYLREHNRLARALKSRVLLNGGGRSLTDEHLFQAARKIVMAQVQHSVYNEFLPVLLGESIMNDVKNELALCSSSTDDPQKNKFSRKSTLLAAQQYCSRPDGHYMGYDARIPPHVSHEFSTAAFRMGHTLLPEFFYRSYLDAGFSVEQRLADHFFDHAQVFEPGAVAGLLHGAMIKNSEAYDTTIVRSVRDDLFKERKSTQGVGMDLYALNIQRSRDHGLQFYNDYRELCGLGRVGNFDELGDVMERENIERLKCAYADVNDVELFPGGLAETPVNNNDGIVGPTFACIIAQQFHQAKKSDRFWYENPGQFTPSQLREVRKFRLARMFCDNSEIKRIQPFALLQPTPMLNAERPCEELEAMNMDVLMTLLPKL